mgnify:FL=1|tara:strand:+ start:310 stop:534 length:225 start_codon:yes stop_codon:yes gene_type:complete
MTSHCFKDLERINFVFDKEGVTRPKRKAKTKKYKLKVIGLGSTPLTLSTNAESEQAAIKYAKARWNDCVVKIIN